MLLRERTVRHAAGTVTADSSVARLGALVDRLGALVGPAPLRLGLVRVRPVLVRDGLREPLRPPAGLSGLFRASINSLYCPSSAREYPLTTVTAEAEAAAKRRGALTRPTLLAGAETRCMARFGATRVA